VAAAQTEAGSSIDAILNPCTRSTPFVLTVTLAGLAGAIVTLTDDLVVGAVEVASVQSTRTMTARNRTQTATSALDRRDILFLVLKLLLVSSLSF